MRSRLAAALAAAALLIPVAAASTIAADPAAAAGGLADAPGAQLGSNAGPAWAVQPSAHVLTAYSAQLQSVSCVSSTWCMATGLIYGSTGTGTLAEEWKSGRWVVVPTPNGITGPNTDPYSQNFLDAVACTSETFCMAIGSAISGSNAKIFAELWDGKHWSLRSLPPSHYVPRGVSVSCVTASFCVAVTQLNAFIWNGTRWRTTWTNQNDDLDAVTCLSTTDCQAVGAGSGELAVRWNGSKWTAEKAPAAGWLYGVTCFSATDCVAVGSGMSNYGRPIASNWNGSEWRNVATLPAPKGNQGAAVGSISCTSTKSCFAVGSYALPGTISKNAVLVDRWDGSKWTLGPSPSFASVPYGEFGTLECTSGKWCIAVGAYGAAEGGPQGLLPLAETWNGSKWSAPEAIDPAGDQDILSASACASVTSCVAVGAIQGGYSSAPLAESWNGTSWTAEPVPVPRATSDAYLTGASCPAPTMCVAVGWAYGSSGNQVVLADSWNGSKWSLMSTSAPPGDGSWLNSVTCLSSKSCTAVGTDLSTTGTQHTLIETWNGSSWSIAHSPTVTGTLQAVSCTSSTSCTAAGSTQSAYGTALIESWDGKTWTVDSVPAAAKGSIGVYLSGISCASSACVAVGQDETGKLISGPTGIPIAEVFNGTAWSTNYPLGLSEASDSILAGVACSAANSCEAIGSFALASGADEALGENWNGTSWVRQPMPPVHGSQSTSLVGVSCLSASACTAVGSYTVLPGSIGLVERYS